MLKMRKKLAWDLYQRPIKVAKSDLIKTINSLDVSIENEKLNKMFNDIDDSNFSEIIKICRNILYET